MEQVLPPDTAAAAGFEKPFLRQFTIFLENRVGRLTMLLRTLEASGQVIIGLSIEESADAALVRLICADAETARMVLKEAGFSFSIIEVLALRIETSERDSLIAVCNALLAAEINIHYCYPLLHLPGGGSGIALYVDDRTFAAQMMMRKQFCIIGESDLKRM